MATDRHRVAVVLSSNRSRNPRPTPTTRRRVKLVHRTLQLHQPVNKHKRDPAPTAQAHSVDTAAVVVVAAADHGATEAVATTASPAVLLALKASPA